MASTQHKQDETTTNSDQQHVGEPEKETSDLEEFDFEPDPRCVLPDGTPFIPTRILFERHMAKWKPQTDEDLARICKNSGVPADRAMEIIRQIEEETGRDLDEAIREQEERELLEQASQAEQKEKRKEPNEDGK